ncbi:MAG: substrate-binding domain-containing protein [Polyangiales bacterium]
MTLGLVLARGGAPAGEAKRARPRIGLSLDTLKEARWQGDRDAFVKRAGELGADVVVQSANSDDVKQVADVKALLTSGIDALVVVAHDGAAMGEAVRLAHASGVPVLSYDRLIRDADVDLFVSCDNVRVGIKQAAYLVEHLPHTREKPLRIVRVLGARTDYNVHQFKQGQDSVLGPLLERGEVKLVFDDWAEDWKPEAAKRIVNAAITQHGDGFDAVLAANDGTAGGAIQALEEEGLTGKVVVTGQDADLVALQRVARGVQAMTIYKPLRTLAGKGAELAVKLATGMPIVARDEVDNGARKVPAVLFDVTVVTRENLRETVIADGFASEQAVYGP